MIVVAADAAALRDARAVAIARIAMDPAGSVAVLSRADVQELSDVITEGLTGPIRFVYGELGEALAPGDLPGLPDRAYALLVAPDAALAHLAYLAMSGTRGSA
ncbi:MAG: hypothetical protein AB7O88_00635 [Reyranellaceae bacterium]